MRGLPTSMGRGLRVAVVVMPPGYGSVGYWRVGFVVTSVTVFVVNALPYGWDGVLLEVEDPTAWFAYLVKARNAGELDCEEIVPAATTVLLRGVRRIPDLSRVRPEPLAANGGEVVLPVWWDGDDLDEVAEHW